MEEYFAPHGTDHQILDGRETRWWRGSFLRIAIVIASLMVIGSGIWLWWWQRTVMFSIPNEQLTIRAKSDALTWIATNQTLPIPDPWRNGVRTSFGASGGTFNQPTWMIVPRWVRPTSGWAIREAHGFYHLLVEASATSTTRSFALRPTKDERLPLQHAFVQGSIYGESETFFFAWNGTLLQTSLPQAPVVGVLNSAYDGSMLTQASPFVAAFLQHLVIADQGIAPWQKDVQRFSWSSPTGTITAYELQLTNASSALASYLGTSSTRSVTRFLQDGTASIRVTSTGTSSPQTIIEGTTETQNNSTCINTKFVPFFRVSGPTLQTTWSRVAASAPDLLEIGSLNERLTVCLTKSASVDK